MQEQINRPMAIEDYEGLCFKCLQKKESVKRYSLYRSEYGSSFDNNYTYLQICDDCEPKDMKMWFDEVPVMIEYCADYKYEKNILEFIDTLPLEGRELFWARCSTGACSDNMEGQDWIDYELGILSHERCKECGYYSPQEKQAYSERFPVCDKVKIVVYGDGSEGERCPFGAYKHMSSECYKCLAFKERTEEIGLIDSDSMEIWELKAKILKKEIEREIKLGTMKI